MADSGRQLPIIAMLLSLAAPGLATAGSKCLVDHWGGDPELAYQEAIKASTGTDADLDHCRAAGLYRWAAERGHAGAQYGLARKYAEGWGEDRDDVLSHMWATMALQNPKPGHFRISVAIKLRRILENDMSQAQINEARARADQCLLTYFQGCESGLTPFE